MPLRVTDSEVREIFDTTIPQNGLLPFIRTANLVVDQITGLSDARLKEIERWLAAAYACAMDPRTTREAIDGASDTYESGSLGAGVLGTHYGQMAASLDTTGTLQRAGMRPPTVLAV